MPDDDIRAQILAEMAPTLSKGQLLEQLDADPKFRGQLRTMVATKFPETAATMPETAVAAAVAPTLAALNAEREALAKERTEHKQAKDLATFRQSLRLQGITERDLPAAEALATERMILDPEAIRLTLEASRHAAAPTAAYGRPTLPGHARNEGDTYWNGKKAGSPSITEDPDGWALARAYKDSDDMAHRRPLDPIA